MIFFLFHGKSSLLFFAGNFCSFLEKTVSVIAMLPFRKGSFAAGCVVAFAAFVFGSVVKA